jgi:predicted Rossmann-fold nucleotide-binding protein
MNIQSPLLHEIESEEQLRDLLTGRQNIQFVAFQNINFTRFEQEMMDRHIENCVILGGQIPDQLKLKLIFENNLLFPEMEVPYKPYTARLYDRQTLYKNYDPKVPDSYKQTLDYRIYQHYNQTGKYNPPSIYETLARRLHDHSITDALLDKLSEVDKKKVVAIMGGHSAARTSTDYRRAALISKNLVEKGYVMLSGGGPGAMEATHFGAWMAGYSNDDFDKAHGMLKIAPTFNHAKWLESAFAVIDAFPKKKEELTDIGIPTWLYGHEPASPFAQYIAKYFANSVREDGLLTYAYGGIIYTPGSAGTIQEIFQDATQNHYISVGMASPMIFMNKKFCLPPKFWTEEKPVYPLLQKLAGGKEYASLLHISDDVEEIIAHIMAFTEMKKG